MSVPNQYKVKIHREPHPQRDFIQIYKPTFAKMYQKLSRAPGALALYIWLVGNQDGFEFDFSPQAIYNNLGMALSTTHDAFRRLKQEGFLIERPGKNFYDFYEIAKGNTAPAEELNIEKEDLECEAHSEAIKVSPREFIF